MIYLGWLTAFGGTPTAESCGVCHAEIYAAWRTSRHAAAATNPVFRASWLHWPNGWCLSCHAPRPSQQIDLLGHVARDGIRMRVPEVPPGTSWKNGVDCITCHVTEAGIRTATAPTERGLAFHPLVQDTALGDERACAGCHEFRFQNHTPRLPFTYGSTLAQSTLSEFRTSKAVDASCQSCHLKGHRFAGAHDEAFVRESLSAEVVRTGSNLTVTVQSSAAHAVPTGDPLRRIELHLCPTAACKTFTIATVLHRVLERTDTSWTVVEDTRLQADQPTVLTVPVGRATWWTLNYRYGDRRFEAVLPPEEVGYSLASGPIPEETP